MPSSPPYHKRNELAALKAKLNQGRGAVRESFMQHHTGAQSGRELAILIDEIIVSIFPAGDEVCLAAVGGYGRGVLSPFSDLDLLIITPTGKKSRTQELADKILYPLWDMGLKVGHATRTINECLSLAKEDITIRTNLLDSRYLAGNYKIFHELQQRYITEVVAGTEKHFISAKLAEMETRHHRMGDSRYFLEPNIKESKGGLRDIDTLHWITRYAYQVGNIAELAGQKLISPEEAKEFQEAREFLLKTRAALHYFAGCAEERLSFDSQSHVAKILGYTDTETLTASERFMKKYFLTASRVSRLTRVICWVLEQGNRKEPRFSLGKLMKSTRKIDGFEVKNSRLSLSEKKARQSPQEIIRLFRTSAETGMDITPEAVRFILQNNVLLTRKIIMLPEVSRMFIDILCARKNAGNTLRFMGDVGVLGRIIPEFNRIRGQMQYDLYHVFTVDEHTLNAVSIIHDIENGELKSALPLSTDVIKKVQRRHVLYLAMLLHDMGKGRGGKQEEMGERIARAVCRRLGLTSAEIEAVAWLVANHLLMTSTVFKRDIEDPNTIQEFVRYVKSPEKLNELLIITVADIRAVGPTIWNDWKAMLLRRIYSESKAMMTGESYPEDRPSALKSASQAITEAMKSFPESARKHYLENAPANYLLYYPPMEHARLALLLAEFHDSRQEVKVSTRIDAARSVTEFTVITRDRPGLFSLIAGALSLSSANIMGAKAFTMKDDTAIDIFLVQDLEGRVFIAQDRTARFISLLRQVLLGEVSLEAKIAEMKGGIFKRANSPLKIQNQIIIDQNSNPDYTIVEVNTTDRLGLLYRLSRTISELGLSIENAHISTYGSMVVDVFYLADKSGHKIKSDTKIEDLKKRLMDGL